MAGMQRSSIARVMWRKLSCLPRRDSSRRFSGRAQIPTPARWLGVRSTSLDMSVETADRSVRATFYAQLKPDFEMGSERTRLPVAVKMALATAGRIGGRAGSPRPVGLLFDLR